MKLGRSACLATIVALGTWSLAACSSDKTTPGSDGGTGQETGSGGKGTGGKGGSGGSSGSAGKAGSGGSSGTAGAAGSAGKAGAAGTAGSAGSTSTDGGNDGGVPSVTITSPADMAKVGPGAAAPKYPDVPIYFKVANFALMAPGTPPAMCPLASCGHVHINVDGNNCNDVASNFPYNVAGISSPLDIRLVLCGNGRIAGMHTVTVSLHDTNHGAIKDSKGNAVADSITIMAALEADGGGGDGGSKKDGG